MTSPDFYHPGWFPVVGSYLTYPDDNGHDLFEVCPFCFTIGGGFLWWGCIQANGGVLTLNAAFGGHEQRP